MEEILPKISSHNNIPEYPEWEDCNQMMFTSINDRALCVTLTYSKNNRSEAAYNVYWETPQGWEKVFQVDMQISNESITNLETSWNEFKEKFPEMIMEHLL